MYTNALMAYSTVLAHVTTPRNEKGQGTLEYLGIAIVAFILVGADVSLLARGAEALAGRFSGVTTVRASY